MTHSTIEFQRQELIRRTTESWCESRLSALLGVCVEFFEFEFIVGNNESAKNISTQQVEGEGMLRIPVLDVFTDVRMP